MPHAVLERQKHSSSNTATEWYFRHGSCSYGPYDCDSLRDVIVAARITADLQLRRACDRDWQEVSTVSTLLNRIDAGISPLGEPSASNAMGFPTTAAPTHLRTDSATARPQVAAATASIRRRRTRPPFLRSFGRTEFLALVTLFVALAGINAVVFGSMMLSHSTEQKYSREFCKIWDELRELRRHSASDQEWSDFAARSEMTLTPIVRDLEKKADVNQPELRHLLWAGRDYLPKMLYDARNSPSQSEKLFERHMEEVRSSLVAR